MSEQRLSRDDIFELIKDGSTSYGEARRYASQWAGMPREKQDFHIGSHLTINLALTTSKLITEGKYRQAVRLMIQVEGIDTKTAIQMIRRSRIESRHCDPIWIGGCGGPDGSYHWPHCKCGWQGENIHGDDSSEKAREKVCPNLKKELAKYGLKYRKA
jgi:hypothetical protein